MSNYFTREQVDILLRPLNPSRVNKDGKGHSHLEAYDVRAHLIRCFGFARWSADLADLALVFETEGIGTSKDGKKSWPTWTVCYRATMRLTICSPDGTELATYTEAATGAATNQPVRADAHDLAIKAAESQALKRCAINLGDGWGLGLYNSGSLGALVRKTLVHPGGDVDVTEPPDAHVEAVAPEHDEASSPGVSVDPLSPGEANAVAPQENQAPLHGSGSEAATGEGAPAEPPQPDLKTDQAMRLREKVLEVPEQTDPPRAGIIALTKLQLDAQKRKLLREQVADRNGELTTLGALIQSEIERRSAAVSVG